MTHAPARARVLLVDDHRENLLALEASLEPLGLELVQAASGEEALRHLLRDEFAVILLDVQMPGLDGFETAELIKQRERTRYVPIVFLTAINKDAAHVVRGYETGAVDYLFKPFDPEILRSKVAVFVELYEKTEQLKRQADLLRRQELAEAARKSEQRYRTLADAIPQIVWTADRHGQATYYNERWFEYTGVPPDATNAVDWSGATHPDDLPASLARWKEAARSGSVFEAELRLRRASDGSYRWHLGRALPTIDETGAVVGWVGTATDIEDRKRAEEAQRFLAEAGALLARSLDYRESLAAVAEAAVPAIADWCSVDLLDGEESLSRLAAAHADPEKLELARELDARLPPGPDGHYGPAHVVRTGRSELVPEIPASETPDERHAEAFRALGLRSYVCVPLVARERVLGAVTFAGAEAGRTYDDRDLALAEEVARRAASAVENAELYAAAEERAQAARVLASIADGVFLLDRGGVVRLWNGAAESVTGLPGAEVIGKRAADVLPGWAELEPRVPVARSGSADARPELIPVELGRRELWLSISGVELEDGTAYAFRDVTEERALEEMKAEFVATVSHELRTPLAAIYGSAMTVRRQDLELGDETRERLLAIISDESDRLAAIVNDLLLASHLDSGRLQVAIESCDVAELARAVLETAKTHLPEGVSLRLRAPKQLPPVAADSGQLRQVLVNLVDNAIKYSPDGGPVEVALDRVDSRVRVAIRDRGLGIPAADQRRIFEKFYRLDPNMTRGIGGTGLGLYICRELVRRVNGRIWVESREGVGSTFFVELPVVEAAASARRAPRRPEPAPA